VLSSALRCDCRGRCADALMEATAWAVTASPLVA
jgi:hypothetical protein